VIESGETDRVRPPGQPLSVDAYSPEQVAERVEQQGVHKSNLPRFATFMLAVLGGGFVGIGAMTQVAILSDPDLNPGTARLAGGIAFAMGYLIAISAGAEIFTSNNLTVMSWAARKLSTRRLLRNWAVVFIGNAVGASGLVITLVLSGHMDLHAGAVTQTATDIAISKGEEGFVRAFFAGVLGNLLICVGVWIAMAGRSVMDRFFAPMLPIAAMSIVGFEHSIGNVYYLLSGFFKTLAMDAPTGAADVFALAALHNLVAVSLGNIVGGGVLVALVYHMIYRRRPKDRGR